MYSLVAQGSLRTHKVSEAGGICTATGTTLHMFSLFSICHSQPSPRCMHCPPVIAFFKFSLSSGLLLATYSTIAKYTASWSMHMDGVRHKCAYVLNIVN